MWRKKIVIKDNVSKHQVQVAWDILDHIQINPFDD
jgi:hypothetical protein